MTEPLELFSRLYREWVDAIGNRDRGWFERAIADDFDCISPLGTRLTKEQLIDLDMTIESPSLTFLEVKAQVLGDLALTQARVRIQERFRDPARLSDAERELHAAVGLDDSARALFAKGSEFIYSSAWRRAGESWQCFHHQGTPVAGS